MGWIKAIGAFFMAMFSAIPILDKWFGDNRTVEDKIEDRAKGNREDVAKEQKNKRPGKPWFMLLFFMSFVLVSAQCDPIIIPGDNIRYIIDTEGAQCSAPPKLNANSGAQGDIDVMRADGFYAHSPAVELKIRDAFARCQEQLRACRKK